jgi:hypothetical protein
MQISVGFGSQTHFHAVGGGGPLTFVSTISIGECCLVEPKSTHNGTKIQRLIEGALIEGKWEHLVRVVGQVINHSEYKAQIQGGYVLFSTALGSPYAGRLFCILVISAGLIIQ